MTDNRVVIEYQEAVDRAPGVQRRFVGESYVVKDAAKARDHHPKATILRYADGRPFVAAQDESLTAVKAKKDKAAEREAAKSTKTVTRTRAKVERQTTPKSPEADTDTPDDVIEVPVPEPVETPTVAPPPDGNEG